MTNQAPDAAADSLAGFEMHDVLLDGHFGTCGTVGRSGAKASILQRPRPLCHDKPLPAGSIPVAVWVCRVEGARRGTHLSTR